MQVAFRCRGGLGFANEPRSHPRRLRCHSDWNVDEVPAGPIAVSGLSLCAFLHPLTPHQGFLVSASPMFCFALHPEDIKQNTKSLRGQGEVHRLPGLVSANTFLLSLFYRVKQNVSLQTKQTHRLRRCLVVPTDTLRAPCTAHVMGSEYIYIMKSMTSDKNKLQYSKSRGSFWGRWFISAPLLGYLVNCSAALISATSCMFF